MKAESLPMKMPDGWGQNGLIPIDKSLPANGFSTRLANNLAIVHMEPPGIANRFRYIIVWNLDTGERMKIELNEGLITNGPVAGAARAAGAFQPPISGEMKS